MKHLIYLSSRYHDIIYDDSDLGGEAKVFVFRSIYLCESKMH